MKKTRFRKFNQLRRQTRKNLSKVVESEQKAFQEWLNSLNQSKRSLQSDLPSSQLPSKMSHINTSIAQVFAIVDTCSIVNFRTEFMSFVTTLRKNFSFVTCPVKFIICLPVLEELDKYNRRSGKGGAHKQAAAAAGENNPTNVILAEQTNHTEAPGMAKESKPFLRRQDEDLRDICRLSQAQAPFQGGAGGTSGPPRSFMRFLEEEMRLGQVIVGELDPFKQVQLAADERAFEIVNSDDRILECCLRSRAFVRSQMHHEATKVLLVSEDNIFKSKATTYGIVSYRWTEFANKFKNFGHENYVATPVPLLAGTQTAERPVSLLAFAQRPIVLGPGPGRTAVRLRTRPVVCKRSRGDRAREVSQWLRDSGRIAGNDAVSGVAHEGGASATQPTAPSAPSATSAGCEPTLAQAEPSGQGEDVKIVAELINLN